MLPGKIPQMISMEIENFVEQSTGEWKSMRSSHSLAFKQFEQILSNIKIEELTKDNLEVKASDEIAETKELIEENNIPSNGLENFGIESIEEETPELFNSDKPLDSEEFKSFENSENSDDEEELEIPAFLRRQKN